MAPAVNHGWLPAAVAFVIFAEQFVCNSIVPRGWRCEESGPIFAERQRGKMVSHHILCRSPGLDLTLGWDVFAKMSPLQCDLSLPCDPFSFKWVLQTVEVPQSLGDTYRQLAERRPAGQPCLSGGHTECPGISAIMLIVCVLGIKSHLCYSES